MDTWRKCKSFFNGSTVHLNHLTITVPTQGFKSLPGQILKEGFTECTGNFMKDLGVCIYGIYIYICVYVYKYSYIVTISSCIFLMDTCPSHHSEFRKWTDNPAAHTLYILYHLPPSCSRLHLLRHYQQETRSGTDTSTDAGVPRRSTCGCRSAGTGAGK